MKQSNEYYACEDATSQLGCFATPTEITNANDNACPVGTPVFCFAPTSTRDETRNHAPQTCLEAHAPIAYDCQAGVGKTNGGPDGHRDVQASSKVVCGQECDAASDYCTAFDYAENASCRLFPSSHGVDYTDSSREYCKKGNVGNGYTCLPGQGPSGGSMSAETQGVETSDECALACDQKDGCAAYDFTSSCDGCEACRLYEAGSTMRTDGGTHDRQYCYLDDGVNGTDHCNQWTEGVNADSACWSCSGDRSTMPGNQCVDGSWQKCVGCQAS